MASFSLFGFSKAFLNEKKSTLVVWLSKNTLTILCLHRVLLACTSRFLHEGFTQSIVVMLLLMPTILLLDKYCPTLIGNKK